MSSYTQQFIKGSFIFSIALFCSIVFVHAENKTITVTLSNAPTSITVNKAPLKYNKNFAYSYVFDDGYGEGYDVAFRYLNGGYVSGDSTTYPGLYYTDGAGNDIPFSAGFATTSLSAAGVDLHDGVTPGYITYSQFDEAYLAGWNVLHHSFGPDGMSYLQDILSGTAYFQSKTANHIKLQHFIIPDGLTGYAQYVFSGGLKSVSEQNTNFFFDGQNHIVTSNAVAVNNLDINKYAMYRQYIWEAGVTTGNIISDVDNIANMSSGSNKLRRHAFSHRVTFDPAKLNGNISWGKWKYLMDHIANTYGKNGNDSAWIAGPQDVYEYVGVKNNVSIQTGLNGNQFTITVNTDNVDADYVRKSLSLLLNVQGATITNIAYQSGAFTNYSNNTQSGLINLDWGLASTGNLNTKVNQYVSQAETYRTQTYINTAQTWIDLLADGSGKTAFQNRVNSIAVQGSIVQINLGMSTNTKGIWNSYNGYVTGNAAFNDLYDTYSTTTTFDISISQSFKGKYAGQAAAIDGSGVYPNNVMDSAIGMYGNALNPATGTVKISGLSPSKQYNFTLFGSTNNTTVGNKTVTIYIIGSTSQELNIKQNIQNTVLFSGVVPDSGGNIYINVEQKDKNRGFGLLNAIVIEEIIGSLPTATVSYSTTQATSNDVVVTLTGFNKTGITITNNGGSPLYTFTGNGTFTFTFQDSQGNNGSKTATVTWINKALMIASVNPVNNGTDVAIDQDIVVEFSKTMNKSSVESNIQISPNPGAKRYQWIGNKLYIMHDKFTNATQYTVSLGANTMDISGSAFGTTYGFIFTTVAGSSNKSWQLDFGYDAYTQGIWNQLNIGNTVGNSNSNLYDANGNATNVALLTVKRGQGKATGTITNNNSGIYPDARIYGNLWAYGKYSTNSGFPESEFMVSGLDPSKTYNFRFYGNTTTVESNPDYSKTVYTIGGQSVILQCSQNTSNEVKISNVSPSSTGTISFSYRAYDETNWRNSYLNVLVIEENGVAVDYVPIPSTDTSNIIETQFIDGGYTKGTGALKSVSASTMVGKKRINFANNAGKLLIPAVLKSSNDLIEVSFPQGAVLSKSGQGFTGILNAPVFLDKTTISNLNNVQSAVQIGDGTVGSIAIKDQSNNSMDAIVRIPAPNSIIGDIVSVYYSQDNGSNWSLQGNYTVISLGGVPYVEFTTNHFTDFAITLPAGGSSFTGTFVINNDYISTTSSLVTLNISTTPTAAKMRFSDDGAIWSARENYATTKSRTLPGTYGINTVYAQFDADGDGTSDVSINDTISYSAPSGGGGDVGPVGGAGSKTAQLHLEIRGTSGYCTYGNAINFGVKDFSYIAKTYATGFLTTSGATPWQCNDTEGKAYWNLTIQSTTVVNANNSTWNIPASRVFIKNPAATKTNGACTPNIGNSNNVRQPLDGPVTILGKTSDLGEVCNIQTNNVTMEIDTLASQALGIYSGTLTLSIPLP